MIRNPPRYDFDVTGVPEKSENGTYVDYYDYEYLFNEYEDAVRILKQYQEKYANLVVMLQQYQKKYGKEL